MATQVEGEDLDVEDARFPQIEGMLSLKDATAQLVHIAKCMEESHRPHSRGDRELQLQVFASRKAGVNALLNLIESYLYRMPET